MTDFYDNATITFNGQPLARTRVEVGERRKGLVFGDVDGAPKIGGKPPPWTASFTATCSTDALKVFAALQPVATPAVTMTVPWKILGEIEVRGWVDDSTLTKNGEGTTVTLGMTADERALARAVSMAVEKAIVHRPSRVAAVNRALLTESDALHRLADAVLHKRGERKKQKAMRRLLRAAGAMLKDRSKGSF